MKNKIADFILHKYFVGISSFVPFHYYSFLPARVWKLAPALSPSETTLLPIFLKSPSETQKVLFLYVVKCYTLLKPKKQKPAQVHKSQTNAIQRKTILEPDSDMSGDKDHSSWKENSTSDSEEKTDVTFISILQYQKIKKTIPTKFKFGHTSAY
jgi:hypothetical protein